MLNNYCKEQHLTHWKKETEENRTFGEDGGVERTFGARNIPPFTHCAGTYRFVERVDLYIGRKKFAITCMQVGSNGFLFDSLFQFSHIRISSREDARQGNARVVEAKSEARHFHDYPTITIWLGLTCGKLSKH